MRIAVNLGQLHGDTLTLARKGNYLNIRTAVDENGDIVPGEVRIVGLEDRRNQHDILTGTSADPEVLRLLPPLNLQPEHVNHLAAALADIAPAF